MKRRSIRGLVLATAFLVLAPALAAQDIEPIPPEPPAEDCGFGYIGFSPPALRMASAQEAFHQAPPQYQVPTFEAGIDMVVGRETGPRVGGLTGTRTVERTEEGQRGTTPAVLERVFHHSFMPLEMALGTLEFRTLDVDLGAGFALRFLNGLLTPIPDPTAIVSFGASYDIVAPAFHQNARADLTTDEATRVVAGFSYSEDDTVPGKMKVRLIAFDQDAARLFDVTVDDNVLTSTGSPSFSRTGLAVDDQGRSTVAYTRFNGGNSASVLARRVDLSGAVLDARPIVINDAALDPSAALLDPAGGRVVIVSRDFPNIPNIIKGNVLDSTAGTPTVGPQFQISTTPGQNLILPSVASNPVTGEFLVVWGHITGTPGNSSSIRARRFDSAGDPVGPDFQVNTLDDGSQGQPAVAFGPNGESVVVWTGDSPEAGDGAVDVFFQVYLANGDPIGGEQRANSFLPGLQDRPVVSFLPDLDPQGSSRFAIYWRDVGNFDGSQPNGTGTSYALFTIAGPFIGDIFVDGFESGDTSAWSSTTP